MPQRHGWLTPDSLPSGTRCITLNVPDDDDFWAMLKGAIVPLFDSSQFEEYGTLTPEQCAQWWVDWDAANDWSECPVSGLIIGEIRLLTANPNVNSWFPCDGASLAPGLYPELFAAIGYTYGQGIEESFKLPDLRGRVVVATGSGSGLTTRAVNDQGGEETHVLTDAEMPSHDHTIGHNHAGTRSFVSFGQGTNPGAALLQQGAGTATVTAALTANSGAAGSDTPHENMPPFIALDYYIYVGDTYA